MKGSDDDDGLVQGNDLRPIPPDASYQASGDEVSGEEEFEEEEEEEEEDGADTLWKSSISSSKLADEEKLELRRKTSRNSMQSDTSEDDASSFDPRQVGMENVIFGDYDMKKSPSTKDFVQSYIDDEMARRNFPGRLSSIMNESLTSKAKHIHRIEEDEPTESSIHTIEHAKSNSSSNSSSSSRHIEISYEDEREPSLNQKPKMAPHVFNAMVDVYREGVESIVDDNFWKCFQSHKPRPWNWNVYLWPFWFTGVLVRYLVLFPIRLIVFALGWIVFGLGMLIVQGCLPIGSRRTTLEHKLISMMCGVFCITWGAVIKYHGSPIKVKPGECQPVYVANHTSMIDVIILQQMRCFSLVGQRHKGIVRFLQEVVLGCLQCVWFDRGEIKDRAAVAKRLKEHAHDSTRNPLLVFPEGTCVNNEYVIQFKKGIFELGVPVVPVAIKYNKMFVDPFWNSRVQSFPMHLVELMTSWCLICEVWYLAPKTRRKDESAEEFAARVKKAIADKAGLKNVNWDGYMKYWKPSERYMQARQKVFAETLQGILDRKNKLDNNNSKNNNKLAVFDTLMPGSESPAKGLFRQNTA